MTSKDIVSNVESLLNKLGDLTDKQLLLVFWQQIDNVKMDKEAISTKDFLQLATNPSVILDARKLVEIMREECL
ncbi:hypothetical protein COE51_01505 [Bacillus pseudomycoides]|nr:hypothetical protein COE51_01505 [Bacillus pseudomycoides]